jgi:hypothetical protein
MSDVSKTVETLLAHARRCRELAASTEDKRMAEELERLAEASVRAAEESRARKQRGPDAFSSGRAIRRLTRAEAARTGLERPDRP